MLVLLDMSKGRLVTDDSGNVVGNDVGPTTIAPVQWPGEQELRWIESEPPELEQYKGQYVAIIGERVVLSAATPAELIAALNGSGLGEPMIHFVPKERFDGYYV